MTAYPTWTPASRPGIVPLQPLGFGTILGRSFSALRHNPRVLLGFALTVQAVAAIIATAAIVAVGVVMFSRLATLQPGSDDFETVMIGSTVLTGIIAFVVSLGVVTLGVAVQGVVVAEVQHAVLAEKLPLRRLWRRVRPVLGRLIGYSLLLLLAVLIAVGAAVGLFLLLSTAIGGWAIIVVLLAALATVPLWLWLSTKLILVPAVIVVEQASIRGAVARSWVLIRGRFWPALGISLIIGAVFGAIAQVVSLPLGLLSTGLTTVVSPTGDEGVGAAVSVIVVSLLTQVITLLIQSISLVVSATASALIYVDCRMRREGLDLDLLAYVDRRDAGAVELPDPYLQHAGQVVPRWQPQAAWPAPNAPWPQNAWPAPTGTPVAPGFGVPTAAPAPAPAPTPAPAPESHSWPPPAPPASPAAPADDSPAPSPSPSPSPSPTEWTAPGAKPGASSGSTPGRS